MTDLEKIKTVAADILTALWRQPIALGSSEMLGGSDRSNVYRLLLNQPPPEGPASVVVKQAARDEKNPYDPASSQGPAWRLFNDWAGLQFLSQHAAQPKVAPRFYGGCRQTGLIVLEDLGKGTQLDHLLLGEDAAAAERGLLDLATSLGRMHAATAGKGPAFRALRRQLGPYADPFDTEQLLQQQRQKIEQLSTELDLPLPAAALDELNFAQTFLAADGPFQAYSHCDPCPDNCLWVGAEMKLLDFEFGAFRHALLDGVYGRIHFPSCWCVNRLPAPIYRRMEQVYRAELVQGCPLAADDLIFYRAVVEACACHLLYSLYLPSLEEDGQWGIATHRQRALVRLDCFAAATETFNHLEALGDLARELATALRRRWPAAADAMPLYPAFRKLSPQLSEE